MKFTSLCFTLAVALLCFDMCSNAEVRTIVVPAGTLMTCSLNELKFSSATVAVGDPFLCYPRSLQQFGQTVFPRGTYIVGHLEADKDPGHFVGKGYLKLVFDRIGLPSGDVPLTAKVVAAGDFTVDRQGKIIGHGHATRDAVEWMFPPLWPWKVMTVPARGPRPTLKGETSVTLRVMEDLQVPQLQTSEGHRFGGESSSSLQPQDSSAKPKEVSMQMVDQDGPRLLPASPVLSTASQMPAGSNPTRAWTVNLTLFVLTNGMVFPVEQYWRNQGDLWYEYEGDKAIVALRNIDWGATTRLNAARNVRVTLRNAPSEN
ncbi:MAG TPA: hypothetical protein VK699_08495 [Terriglobales bacterium]|jgi:hypothetical protein|nr:hypothetical protein [Terriglobales bacterium]